MVDLITLVTKINFGKIKKPWQFVQQFSPINSKTVVEPGLVQKFTSNI